MHADEDVGKIAMAVPLLVSKALELFLQDLCDRTYEITLMKGAKTMNSSHLEIIGKVPDLGGLDAAGEELNVPKKRKVDDDDEPKKSRMHETFHVLAVEEDAVAAEEEGIEQQGERMLHIMESLKMTQTFLTWMRMETLSHPSLIANSNREIDEELGWSLFEIDDEPRADSIPENKDKYPGWLLTEIEKMAIDPVLIANSNREIDDEDYDEEG
ncbi:hypothetical protein F3Y22_tig00116997pilonHSYRG00194 [Hibiscus syriacus]|uniref:Transcription factor CBF/NF-Y/archaeal histone domain-containing protein n=1 Tax=Hibiscus syriacus TaxID=106335 RepID=A0A6A2WE58_HIBSY|nr:hypothetical protein F3Y22_tig00116997pilonHSYRG00194 [Hibiscus syriacus]